MIPNFRDGECCGNCENCEHGYYDSNYHEHHCIKHHSDCNDISVCDDFVRQAGEP